MPRDATELSPVQLANRASLRECALEQIRLAISTGELTEGKCYSAAGLARDLGISLSPVREAMMSLVSEGTVEAVPNRGFRLVHVSWDELEEIIRIRVLLSRPAVEQLCQRAGQRPEGQDPDIADQINHLRSLALAAVAAVDAEDLGKYSAIDRRFHRSLLGYGLGRRAADISLRLRDQSRIPGAERPSLPNERRSAQSLVDLVELIDEGESTRAQDLVEQNLYYFRNVARQ